MVGPKPFLLAKFAPKFMRGNYNLLFSTFARNASFKFQQQLALV